MLDPRMMYYTVTRKLIVKKGDTVLLRVINAALNQQLFFSVANHKLTVVATDAVYTKQFTTNVIMLGPGQTTDVLLTTDQQPGRYYMAARAYASAMNVPFDNTTATAILEYKSSTSQPILPQRPAYNDTNTVTVFSNQLKSPGRVTVPTTIDDNLFIAMGLRFFNCSPGPRCQGPNNTRFGASMNNVSFVLPRRASCTLGSNSRDLPPPRHSSSNSPFFGLVICVTGLSKGDLISFNDLSLYQSCFVCS